MRKRSPHTGVADADQKPEFDAKERVLSIVAMGLLHRPAQDFLKRHGMSRGVLETLDAVGEIGDQGRLAIGDVKQQVRLKVHLTGPDLVDGAGGDGGGVQIAGSGPDGSPVARWATWVSRDVGQRRGDDIVARLLAALTDHVDGGGKHELAGLCEGCAWAFACA